MNNIFTGDHKIKLNFISHAVKMKLPNEISLEIEWINHPLIDCYCCHITFLTILSVSRSHPVQVFFTLIYTLWNVPTLEYTDPFRTKCGFTGKILWGIFFFYNFQFHVWIKFITFMRTIIKSRNFWLVLYLDW